MTVNGYDHSASAEVVVSIEQLLATAEASDVPSVVNLARQIRDLLIQLIDELRTSQRERELREKARSLSEELEQVNDELKRLESERGATSTGRHSGPKGDLAKVREWAMANGYQVFPRGAIARSVMQAYEKATAAGVAS